MRDLVQDDYGNYYEIISVSETEKEIVLVNYFMHSTFKRILNESFKDEVDKKYGKSVAVGQIFTDMLKQRVDMLRESPVPGEIYHISDILEKYKVENIPLYEREVGI